MMETLRIKVKVYKNWASTEDFIHEIDQFNRANEEIIEAVILTDTKSPQQPRKPLFCVERAKPDIKECEKWNKQ